MVGSLTSSSNLNYLRPVLDSLGQTKHDERAFGCAPRQTFFKSAIYRFCHARKSCHFETPRTIASPAPPRQSSSKFALGYTNGTPLVTSVGLVCPYGHPGGHMAMVSRTHFKTHAARHPESAGEPYGTWWTSRLNLLVLIPVSVSSRRAASNERAFGCSA